MAKKFRFEDVNKDNTSIAAKGFPTRKTITYEKELGMQLPAFFLLTTFLSCTCIFSKEELTAFSKDGVSFSYPKEWKPTVVRKPTCVNITLRHKSMTITITCIPKNADLKKAAEMQLASTKANLQHAGKLKSEESTGTIRLFGECYKYRELACEFDNRLNICRLTSLTTKDFGCLIMITFLEKEQDSASLVTQEIIESLRCSF